MFSRLDMSRFLKQFGGEVVSSSTTQRRAICNFTSHQDAYSAMRNLHQKVINGCLLYVEFYQDVGKTKSQHYDEKHENDQIEFVNSFVKKMNMPIQNITFSQPPPPYLKYSYPKASKVVTGRIAKTLLRFPRFYIQVCHLMNKMNLPAPFDAKCMSGDTILCKDAQTQTDITYDSVLSNDLDSDESEMASSGSEGCTSRPLRKKKIVSAKSKRETFRAIIEAKKRKLATQDTASDGSRQEMLISEVFETDPMIRKAITIVVPSELNASTTSNTQIPQEKLDTSEENNFRMKRLSPSQIASHPLFANYSAGCPSNKLYIKNVSKTVTESDLRRVYQPYSEEEIEIRLMQTGRMKGQAFLTFSQSANVAKALAETNGLILNEKFIIVAFGKT